MIRLRGVNKVNYRVKKNNENNSKCIRKSDEKNTTQYMLITTLVIIGLYRLFGLMNDLRPSTDSLLSSRYLYTDLYLYMFTSIGCLLIILAFAPIGIYLIKYCYYLYDSKLYTYESVNEWYSLSIQNAILTVFNIGIIGIILVLINLFSDFELPYIDYMSIVFPVLVSVLVGILMKLKFLKNSSVVNYQMIGVILAMVVFVTIQFSQLYAEDTLPEDCSILIDRNVYTNSDDIVVATIKGVVTYKKAKVWSIGKEDSYYPESYVIDNDTIIKIDLSSSYFTEGDYIITIKINDRVINKSFAYFYDEGIGSRDEYVNKWIANINHEVEKNEIMDLKLIELINNFESCVRSKEATKSKLIARSINKYGYDKLSQLIWKVLYDEGLWN